MKLPHGRNAGVLAAALLLAARPSAARALAEYQHQIPPEIRKFSRATAAA